MRRIPSTGAAARELERPSSRKWSLHPGTIGAWVAEMDFGTAPVVTEALHRAIDDETLGYLSPATAAEMGAATAGWMRREYGWTVDPDRVHPVSDVMAALRVAVEEFSPEGSAVIVPTPAYMPFLTYLPSIGRPVVQVPGHARPTAAGRTTSTRSTRPSPPERARSCSATRTTRPARCSPAPSSRRSR